MLNIKGRGKKGVSDEERESGGREGRTGERE